MPIYCYRCENCKQTFEVKHGMFFEQDMCTLCNRAGFLTKVYLPTSNEIDKNKIENKVGDVVKSHIEQVRKELKEEKKKHASKEL